MWRCIKYDLNKVNIQMITFFLEKRKDEEEGGGKLLHYAALQDMRGSLKIHFPLKTKKSKGMENVFSDNDLKRHFLFKVTFRKVFYYTLRYLKISLNTLSYPEIP